MRLITAALFCVTCMTAPVFGSDFQIDFSWNGLASCTTGKPKTVPNPAFAVKGLPPGTQVVEFKLTDLDARSYRHGGGAVGISTDGTVPPGVFKYKSPCPPNGSHTYVWTATAKDQAGREGKVLGTAQASRQYPE